MLLFASWACIFAWTWASGLIAENWDIITVAKWNDLLNYINLQTKTAVNTDRDDNDINLTRYYGTQYSDGTWKIDRETWSTNALVRNTATNNTNPGQTNYSAAWTNRTTLTY